MSQSADLSHVHRFEPGEGAALHPLLLLHGTGGDEGDLLPLGRAIAPNRALLSPRGQVLENGMPRFFRRLAEGVFDEADLIERTERLADFVGEARSRYGLETPVAIGFSNGANIAASLFYRRPETLAGAILIRAMMPFASKPLRDLAGIPILVLSGAQDPIIPAANSAGLVDALATAGATVEHHVLPAGHGLTQTDMRLAAEWLGRQP